jgi:hypothetical protein
MTGSLHEDQCTFMIVSHSFLLIMRNFAHKSCRENQNTHFVFSNFFPKIVPFMRKVEKHGRARQATNDNMAHAHCVLDN